MRYFLELAYSGAEYCGWQRQPTVVSVQQTLEQSLSKLLRHEVLVVGCGRTDTGVNASYYVAHFDSYTELPENFIFKINCVLPGDIAIFSIQPVFCDAHARFDAVRREYKYYIKRHKCPFSRNTTWQYYHDLDVAAMNRAAESLLVNDDFETFSKLHSGNKTTLCKVDRASWEVRGDELIFTISSDRFLRNMVRSIVSTLVDVGRRKITPEQFVEILHSHDRSRASAGAPPQGLFLTNVEYEGLLQPHKLPHSW